MIRFDILTIFPKMFESPLEEGILKRAKEKGFVKIEVHNLRDFASDRHKSVDDYPYGGGKGMIMKPGPIIQGIERVKAEDPAVRTVLLTPQGRRLDQKWAKGLAQYPHLLLICGRYEGVDERVRYFVDEEISIGDYILMGGEVAAMVIVEVIARLIPGVLGKEMTDTFYDGLLEFPQYTRPNECEVL